ncbi:hypothetical protein [Cellulophaga baltica]|uniref:hypothetical protein n=1 Tax=Cellulophaga baltica TaxID=76594 RepID=UPI0012DCC0EB|nr:hypothetical protein [Cellulophaga baltica]
MDSQPNKSNSNILSIIGIVFGISSLIFSIIPCLGIFAIIFGSIAVILSIIAVIRVFMLEQAKALAIIAMAVSLLGIASIGLQFYLTSKVFFDQIELQEFEEIEEIENTEELEEREELEVIPEELPEETSFN